MSHTRDRKLPVLELTESQVKRLERLWFIYGNHGPKHRDGNHKFIQRFLDAQQDQREGYRAHGISEECEKAIDAILNER